MDNKKFDEELLVSIKERVKYTDIVVIMNNISRELIIKKRDNNVIYVFCLGNYEEEFEQGRSMNSIIEEIISRYNNMHDQGEWLVEEIYDFNKIERKLEIKEFVLEGNMLFAFYVPLVFEKNYNMGFVITNTHLELWHMKVEELLLIYIFNNVLDAAIEHLT